MSDTINFEEILRAIESNPQTKQSLEDRMIVTPTYWGASIHKYAVHIPKKYVGKISDDELINRCDNKSSNLLDPDGGKYHFGGLVDWESDTMAEVSVFVD